MPLLPQGPRPFPRPGQTLPTQQLQPSVTNTMPQVPQYQPPNLNTNALDDQIRQIMGQMGGASFQPGQFQYQEDPRYSQLIQQLQGQQGQYGNQLAQLQQQMAQPFQPSFRPQQFQFSGGSEMQQLQATIARLMSGQGIGQNINVESDPAAAAYRTARERQAQYERSALAERMGATGESRTGGADVALLGGQQEAGRDIAGYEANLANQRRGEVLQQMLSGAQLGLENLSGRRQAEQQAFMANQQNLGNYDLQRQQGIQQGFAGQLAALQGSDPRGAMLQALQQAQGARGQAFGEFTTGEGMRAGAFESGQAGQRDALSRLEAERNQQRQMQLGLGQQGFENQMAQYQAAEARRAQLEREKTGKTERELLEEELKERKKKNKGPGGGLPVPGMGNTPWNPFKRS